MPASSVWVTWPSLPLAAALLMLSNSREQLFKNNLFHTKEPFPQAQCNARALVARTENGSCNDLDTPMMGAAMTRFGRNVPLAFTYPESEENLLSPNPRTISRELLSRSEFKPATSLNLLAAAWIQFETHDWFFHQRNFASTPIEVPLLPGDPLGTVMRIPRSHMDMRTAEAVGEPPSQINTVTHWWDSSQVYGSNAETNRKLRTFQGGRLVVAEDGLLPVDPATGKEVAGMSENWWVGVSFMHHVFVKEHNAIADYLKSKHPDWNDQRLYDTARLINAALIAKIHTVEWTPAILNNPVLKVGMNANWDGLLGPDVGSAIELPSPALTGLVGNKRELHGVPYSITQEFVSVYRMHPLMPDWLDLKDAASGNSIDVIPVTDTQANLSRSVLERVSLANLAYSFGKAHPGALTLNNYPRFLQDAEIPELGHVDMAAIDLVRDRERGVPRYNQFRRLIGLKPIRDFSDLTNDAATVEKMRRIYENDVERIDLLVGTLAESVRPAGFGFGETAFQVFILMASRRLQADRFFTTDYRPEIYTAEGLKWIRDNSFKTVLLRHFPQLNRRLANVKNAFQPW